MSKRKVAPTPMEIDMAANFLAGASVKGISEAWNKHPMTVEAALRSALALRPGARFRPTRALSRLRSLSGLRAPSTGEGNSKLPRNSARSQSKKGARK